MVDIDGPDPAHDGEQGGGAALSVMTKIVYVGFIVLLHFCSSSTRAASETLTVEPSGEAYNFVAHYRVLIDAPVSKVWPILIDFRSWMYEFELSTVSGTPGTPGHVLRLYEGQDFLIQVAGVDPERMLTIVNLPLTFKGEYGTGVGIITLHQLGNTTEVSLSMSRRYTPAVGEFSELRDTRLSDEFQARTRAMWQDRFLGRLRALAERRIDGD